MTDDPIASLYNELHPLSPHSSPWLILTPEQQQAVRAVADRRYNVGFDDGERRMGRELEELAESLEWSATNELLPDTVVRSLKHVAEKLRELAK